MDSFLAKLEEETEPSFDSLACWLVKNGVKIELETEFFYSRMASGRDFLHFEVTLLASHREGHLELEAEGKGQGETPAKAVLNAIDNIRKGFVQFQPWSVSY